MTRERFLEVLYKHLFEAERFANAVAKSDEKIVIWIVGIASAAAGLLVKFVLDHPYTSPLVRFGTSGFAAAIGAAVGQRLAAREVRYWSGRARQQKQGMVEGWMSVDGGNMAFTPEVARDMLAQLNGSKNTDLKRQQNRAGVTEQVGRSLLWTSCILFVASGILVILGVVWRV